MISGLSYAKQAYNICFRTIYEVCTADSELYTFIFNFLITPYKMYEFMIFAVTSKDINH